MYGKQPPPEHNGDSICDVHAQGVLCQAVKRTNTCVNENLSEQGAGSVYLNAAFNLSLLALFISFKKRTYAKAPIDSANKVKAS